MRVHFRSFRARILTFVFGLLVLVQGVTLLSVNDANVRNARQHIEDVLGLTATAFRRSIQVRDQILQEKAGLLSSDFAFKQAVGTGEHETILSTLENHQARMGANVMMLASMEDRLLADTLHPETRGGSNPLLPLVDEARDSEFGEASGIEFIDGRPYQLVVVPLFAPEPIAWILIGFAIDDAFTESLGSEMGTHVTLLERESTDRWIPFASTLPESLRKGVGMKVEVEPFETDHQFTMELTGDQYVSWLMPAGSGRSSRVMVLLQRSLDEALAPYLRLQNLLLVVFVAGLVFSVAGGALLANRVTRPVAVLAGAARRIRYGDYDQPVSVPQKDELGLLASSFNRMMKGLAERDRVRTLLGKVVSPAVAEELMRRGLELGGEERVVSVLFSDIRNFTTISEREKPQDLVKLLNTYLTHVTSVVEQHGGVVDKYIGDAVMALFGAPLAQEGDAQRAVQTGLDMAASLDAVNAELGLTGEARLAIGVGIHTDMVVAGNMGSLSRLNYTVIGDGVNLASRLEGLTKYYGVAVIVSEATREACPEFAFRELDRVRVKGRREPVRIFEPLGPAADLSPDAAAELERHREGLGHFLNGRWREADETFAELEREAPASNLYGIYRARIRKLESEPPPDDWDGAFNHDQK